MLEKGSFQVRNTTGDVTVKWLQLHSYPFLCSLSRCLMTENRTDLHRIPLHQLLKTTEDMYTYTQSSTDNSVCKPLFRDLCIIFIL